MGGTGWAVKEFSWDNKYAGLQVLLSKVAYSTCMNGITCNMLPRLHSFMLSTPIISLLQRQSSSVQMRNFNLRMSSILPNHRHADYILGKNPKSMSYLVGYGQNYPFHAHHRGASIASISILPSLVGCVQGYESWYRRPEGNPNVLFGALVGGPSNNDEFSDDRTNYEQTEPTISGTAPLVGLFSKLQILNGHPDYNWLWKLQWPLKVITQSDQGPTAQLQVSRRPNDRTKLIDDAYTNIYSYDFTDSSPKAQPVLHPQPDVPVKFFHAITESWRVGGLTYYRHKVTVKNVSKKPITDLKLTIENLKGSLWGIYPTQEKNTYEFPKWLKVLKPDSEATFVYVQGGPQAKVSIKSYH
ncbi:hypothetical protein RJ640_028249 [Escallonia rubra]|uniref:Endoglucanase n=1 Tax=Escallonia rubra TaxID=112253 RepID=A0AA88UTA4_9ASTE|nr:hypothetical protein RJ640_028249 [Escallonia rubra]